MSSQAESGASTARSQEFVVAEFQEAPQKEFVTPAMQIKRRARDAKDDKYKIEDEPVIDEERSMPGNFDESCRAACMRLPPDSLPTVGANESPKVQTTRSMFVRSTAAV